MPSVTVAQNYKLDFGASLNLGACSLDLSTAAASDRSAQLVRFLSRPPVPLGSAVYQRFVSEAKSGPAALKAARAAVLLLEPADPSGLEPFADNPMSRD